MNHNGFSRKKREKKMAALVNEGKNKAAAKLTQGQTNGEE